MDEIQNTVAKIHAIEDLGNQIKLKDDNKKSLGSFFKTKKDGNFSQAYQQFKDMEIQSGSIVNISYKLNPDKNDPKIVYKNIIGFREAGAMPLQTPQVSKPTSTPTPAVKYVPSGNSDATDWDKIAVGKCQTAFLAAYIQSGKTISEAKLQAVAARQLAEIVVYGTQGKDEPLPEPPPDVQDIADNIPF